MSLDWLTPNNPVERTAHSADFSGHSWRFLLWAAAHRERSAALFRGERWYTPVGLRGMLAAERKGEPIMLKLRAIIAVLEVVIAFLVVISVLWAVFIRLKIRRSKKI
jgi:hypothetical protein